MSIEKVNKSLILLLDDDEDDYVLIKAMLNGAFGDRIQMDWFQRDHFATEMICSEIYQLTLVDFHLGDTNGIEVIEKVKASCPAQILILVTAWPDPLIAETARIAGADAYLDKGELSMERLKVALEPFLKIA